jgi:type I restriction-modification system DNA methylase subunit
LFTPTDNWWECKGIFSPSYVRTHLSQYTPNTQEVSQLYQEFRALWVRNLSGLRQQGEAYTRSRFLDPILRRLGWYFIPERSLPKGRTKKRPDYCLFRDEETEQDAASGENAQEVFASSSSVLEAKRAEKSLDEIVQDRETPGWFPSQQIQDYLHYATDFVGTRFFQWAVLANGNEWRLYCHDAAPDAYFAFHLAHGDTFCPLDEFRLFVGLFQPAAFNQDAQRRCLLDSIRDESLTQQTNLEENLRRRVFDVLEDLAEGYLNNPENKLTENDLAQIYDCSLIFLYRLLFILYAESRGLLPAKPFGAAYNRRYRDEFSLVRLINSLRDPSRFNDDAFDGLYRQLLALFDLVNGTRVEQNTSLSVTRYNGRLFDPNKYPNVRRWWVGERTLAAVLKQLTFAQPPSRGRTGQRVIHTDDTLDYSTLEVRQLGDIYEGLLGGRLEMQLDKHLVLVGEQGQNRRSGIFYTPDWIVHYLVRETLEPLIKDIENQCKAATAPRGRSRQRLQDNSFAEAVLKLNCVDPAMGSGHFLVRATEYLARRIFEHSSTSVMTEVVTTSGTRSRTTKQIRANGKVPVPPGLSQEQAEIAYWRRRVVENCIYGVDVNQMAVELAKVSLWLTCIAVDEPLSFLDHHLGVGNSLIGASINELQRLPSGNEPESQEGVFTFDASLANSLASAIQKTVDIETTASTAIELVKQKEDLWKRTRAELQPFRSLADVWIGAVAGLPISDIDYRQIGAWLTDKGSLSPAECQESEKAFQSWLAELQPKLESLHPFHWEIEFPEVFFQPNGQPLPSQERGFDVVLGNPPYVSTHTSSTQEWRNVLEKRAGYIEDLYLHFTDCGFSLLKKGGKFGFIVSDTFFTAPSKRRMREQLQQHRLTHLGQCVPFDATVDAAVFVAENSPCQPDSRLLFIQARYSIQGSTPDTELSRLPLHQDVAVLRQDVGDGVAHDKHGCLRLHNAPLSLYHNAWNRVFFEPREHTLKVFTEFNEKLKSLTAQWFDLIRDPRRFDLNRAAIEEYQRSLRPGDVTMAGIIAEGAQGMRTGDNARFLGYLEGTTQADELATQRHELTKQWEADDRIKPLFHSLISQNGGDSRYPTRNVPAWEAACEGLRKTFRVKEDLGFNRTALYRVVPRSLIAQPSDFEYVWKQRKAELWHNWKVEAVIRDFWNQDALLPDTDITLKVLRARTSVTDEVFCAVCENLLAWWNEENSRRRNSSPRRVQIPLSVLSLHPGEKYEDSADAPRVAAVYNGLSGRHQWVPYRKGDPEGSRWADNDPLYIDWSAESVEWLSTSASARWQGHALFFTPGVTWSAVANHVALKARYQEPCVFDADSMRLTPKPNVMAPMAFLAILNSDILSFIKMKFIRHSVKWEIGDLRSLPIVIPTRAIVHTQGHNFR